MSDTNELEPTLRIPQPTQIVPRANGAQPHESAAASEAAGEVVLPPHAPPVEDLTRDKLLLAAQRRVVLGRTVPMLGGIALLSKIGQGGMGAVYFGMHLRLNNEVAVKVLPFLLAEQNPEMIKRFFQEAKFAARIKSSYLVAVSDVNEENGLFFLVMEYIDGLSAGAYLRQQKKVTGIDGLPENVVLEIALGAATGLAAAHAENVIHRDIKPDNILIGRDREKNLQFRKAKIADLGLAKSDDTSALTGSQVMGSPGYMAPEQALQTRLAGKPADVFSLGATLYALLTGAAPFKGASATEIIMATVQGMRLPIQEVRPGLSPIVCHLIERCLSKDPTDRFQSADSLLGALLICAKAHGMPHDRQEQLIKQVEKIRVFADSGKPRVGMAPTVHTSPSPFAIAPPPVQTVQISSTPVFQLPDSAPVFKVPSASQTQPAPMNSAVQTLVSPAGAKPAGPLRWVAAGLVLAGLAIAALLFFVQKPTLPETLSLQLGGDTSLELNLIQPGSFMMGSPNNEEGRFTDEGPRQLVKLTEPFYAGIHEVTQAQYEAIMKANPSRLKDPTHPVENVSYEDATEFCKNLSARIGRSVTLPTEAQWEYLCRAGTTTPFSIGGAVETTQANVDGAYIYGGSSAGRTRKRTTPVASFKPNEWGLYDLHGNVWEWCQDAYRADAYSAQQRTDPLETRSGPGHILRGGSWNYPPLFARSAARFWLPPINRAPDAGFRVVVVVK